MIETVYRPWGCYNIIFNGHVVVKVIKVEPGQKLSEQYHLKRTEYWQAIDAGLEATIDGKTFPLIPGENHRIRAGEIHRLANASESSARLCEVIQGTYDEEDIVRIADEYGRV